MTNLLSRNRQRLNQASTVYQLRQQQPNPYPPPTWAKGHNPTTGKLELDQLGQGTTPATPITNGAIGIGDRVTLRGNLADAMPMPRLVAAPQLSQPKGILWTFSAVNGAAWSQSGNTITISFEDSANCGGGNNSIQTGTAIGQFSSTSPGSLIITANGRIETQNPGYEQLLIAVATNQAQPTQPPALDRPTVIPAFSAQSTRSNGGCVMEDVNFIHQLSLPAGKHVITVWSSTIDGQYHTGAFWRVNFEFRSNTP